MFNRNFFLLSIVMVVVSSIILLAFLDVNQKQGLVKIDVPLGLSGTLPTSPQPSSSASPAASMKPVGLANPASTFCTDKGGTLVIQKRSDGAEYGLCSFENAYACEEWALLRGECPVGGVNTTGYDTVAQKYCAWVGGQTFAEPNAKCTFDDGSSCKNTDLFSGNCQKGDNAAQK